MEEQRVKLDYKDVKRQLPGWVEPLEKPYHRGDGAEIQAVKECNLPPDLEEVLTRLGSRRDGLHLLRLLKRSEVERAFGIAYLQNCSDAYAQLQQDARAIIEVICSEGCDTMMFWTFAPYIFKSLKEKNVPDGEAVQKVLAWSKDGVSVMHDYQGRADYNYNHLRGLENFDRDSWFLRKDPNDISHQFTEQEAERVAGLLMEE